MNSELPAIEVQVHQVDYVVDVGTLQIKAVDCCFVLILSRKGHLRGRTLERKHLSISSLSEHQAHNLLGS